MPTMAAIDMPVADAVTTNRSFVDDDDDDAADDDDEGDSGGDNPSCGSISVGIDDGVGWSSVDVGFVVRGHGTGLTHSPTGTQTATNSWRHHRQRLSASHCAARVYMCVCMCMFVHFAYFLDKRYL